MLIVHVISRVFILSNVNGGGCEEKLSRMFRLNFRSACADLSEIEFTVLRGVERFEDTNVAS